MWTDALLHSALVRAQLSLAAGFPQALHPSGHRAGAPPEQPSEALASG